MLPSAAYGFRLVLVSSAPRVQGSPQRLREIAKLARMLRRRYGVVVGIFREIRLVIIVPGCARSLRKNWRNWQSVIRSLAITLGIRSLLFCYRPAPRVASQSAIAAVLACELNTGLLRLSQSKGYS